MLAHVDFYKDVEKDNWDNGCTGSITCIYYGELVFSFENTTNLVEKLAEYISNNFDVDINEFVSEVNNECGNKRFDYCQNEDGNGDKITLTKDNPDGYLAQYSFLVTKVTKEIEYTFDL